MINNTFPYGGTRAKVPLLLPINIKRLRMVFRL